jgi:hypothetical protein
MPFYEYENDFIMLATSKTKQELEAAERLKMKSKKTENKVRAPETVAYKTPFTIKRRRYMANASRFKNATDFILICVLIILLKSKHVHKGV